MKAYIHLLNVALGRGYTVSVWDGEEWSLKRSTDLAAIKAEVEGVEEALLKFRDSDGNVVGKAVVSVYGLADDETVIDHSLTTWIEEALR